MMSWFQTPVQPGSAWKKVLMATSVALLSPSSAFGQQKPYDSGMDQTKSEQYTYFMYCADGWFSQDKIYHFMSGFIVTASISGGLRIRLNRSRKDSVSMASSAIFSIGIIKEIYDSRQRNNHFCWKDLTADVIGILFGGCFWLNVNWDEM